MFIRHVSHILDSPPHPLITLEWSPGHSGVTGNEEADRIANPSVLHTTIACIKQRANQSINEAWQRQVRGLVKTKGTKLLEVYPVSRI